MFLLWFDSIIKNYFISNSFNLIKRNILWIYVRPQRKIINTILWRIFYIWNSDHCLIFLDNCGVCFLSFFNLIEQRLNNNNIILEHLFKTQLGSPHVLGSRTLLSFSRTKLIDDHRREGHYSTRSIGRYYLTMLVFW